jgi:hypothetical protein
MRHIEGKKTTQGVKLYQIILDEIVEKKTMHSNFLLIE